MDGGRTVEEGSSEVLERESHRYLLRQRRGFYDGLDCGRGLNGAFRTY